MKRFVKKLFLFFAIIGGVDFVIGGLGDFFQSHPKGGAAKRINDLMMHDCHDIVILGSSRARHHYDTPFLSDKLGLDVYNAGYDGNGVVFEYGLLTMILERYQPKLVLCDIEPAFDIDVNPQDNGHKRYIAHLKPYYRESSINELIYNVSIEEWFKVHSGLIRYNSTLISMIVDNYLKIQNDHLKGYKPLEGVFSKPNERKKTVVEVDSFKLAYVEKLILLSHFKQVPIAFVSSPKYGEETSMILKPVKDICEKYNIRFFDHYNDTIFMQHKEWFKDPVHLNRKGAQYYSQRIIKDINLLIEK